MTTPLPVLRRSAAELLASAAIELFPGALLAGGGATEFGFYYDIIAEQPVDDHALPLLEERMRARAKEAIEVRALDMMRENASSFMEHRNQPIQAERILELPVNIVQMIQFGSFTDSCEAPYVANTEELSQVKLLRVEVLPNFSGEIDELQVKRIVGIISHDKSALKQLTKALAGGAKQDHRKYAKERGFFENIPDLSDHALILGNSGTLLKDLLVSWWKNAHRKRGFSLVTTPNLIKAPPHRQNAFDEERKLHLDCEINGIPYVLPLNPLRAHILIFNSMSHSANDLPIRLGEVSPCVPSGSCPGLWGAFAAELSTGDFAHIFCTAEQLEAELISSLQFIAKFTKLFGFEYRWNFAGQGKSGATKQGGWQKAFHCFESALEKCGCPYSIDETSAPRGPQAMSVLIDRFGREWKGPEIAIDLSLVERLGAIQKDAQKEPGGKRMLPFLIACTAFGSVERFAALLLEHNQGTLPFWLAPEQVRVIPVGVSNTAYALHVSEAIEKDGYRANADCGNHALGKKIHGADNDKIPFTVIVGEKEENEGLITVRFAGGEGRQQTMTLEAFLKQIKEEEPSKAPSADRRKAKQIDG